MFNISKSIPTKLSFSVKENIPALTGTIISSCYYLSINDYLNIVFTVNGLIDHLNFLYPQINNINFTSPLLLCSRVTNIITSNFVSITGIINENNIIRPIENNINILTNFNINDNYYQYNTINNGNIIVMDNLISGNVDTLVHTFNGKQGDVTGINGIILNGKRIEINDGIINLSNLSFKNEYIESINNSNFNTNVTNIITEVKVNNITYLPSDSFGNVELNTFIIKTFENNKLNLKDNNLNNLNLQNVDLSDDRSAINKNFLINNYKNDLIIRINNITAEMHEIILPKQYYPLHFYDEEGVWLNNINWNIQKNDDNNIIIVDDISNIKTMTAMKVEE